MPQGHRAVRSQHQHNYDTSTSTNGHHAVLAAATLGLITYTYRRRRSSATAAPPEETPTTIIPRPSDDFSHPYSECSALERLVFMCRRYVYLTCLFLPCAALGWLSSITQSDSLRKRFIQLLVRSFELAGCSFQKFGQWMSMRPDMFPQDIVRAMSQLQMDVPEHSFGDTREIIRDSLGFDIDEVFEAFDESAVASGSVGQVYRAVVRPTWAKQLGLNDGETGAQVAVKVRHPSVLDETFVDVDVIFDTIKGFDWLGIMTAPFSKSAFIHLLQKQLNFEWEAHALGQFSNNFKTEVSKGEVAFPRVVPELLSDSVLVESWAPGNTIAEAMTEVGEGFKELVSGVDNAIQAKRHALAENIFNVCMKMFLRDNLMHGDLHAGNILFQEDGALTMIDAGFTTTLEESHKPAFGRFMKGMINGNPDDIVDALLRFNDGEGRPAPKVDTLRLDVQEACDKFIAPDGRGHDGRPVCVGDVMGHILFNLGKHNIRLSGDVATSLVSIAVSEGVIRQLDPDFDMNRRALPYLAQYGMGF